MVSDAEDNEPASSYLEAVRRGVPFRDQDGSLQYPTVRSRPRANFTLDSLHRYLLLGSLVVAVGYSLWMIIRIPSMPDEVPMHFSADGSVNRYGSPWEMLIVVALMLGIIIGCAVLTRFPHVYNLNIGKVTEENIQAHYKNGVQMMVWLVFSCTLLYVVMLGSIADGWSINPWVWVSLAILAASTTFFILRSRKL